METAIRASGIKANVMELVSKSGKMATNMKGGFKMIKYTCMESSHPMTRKRRMKVVGIMASVAMDGAFRYLEMGLSAKEFG